MGNGIPKEVSLDIIEKIVDGNVDFKAFGPIEGFEYLALEDYPVHRFDAKYKQLIRSRMQIRLNFLLSFNQNNPKLALPVEAISRLERVINNLK